MLALCLLGCADSPAVDLPAARAGDPREPKPLSWAARAGLAAFLDLAAWSQFESGYVALFALGEFAAVVADAAHNLEIVDFCHQYAAEDDDKSEAGITMVYYKKSDQTCALNVTGMTGITTVSLTLMQF